MPQASGGIDGWPRTSHPMTTTGTMTAEEAAMPTAAVRSGSSAALSRMFQPAWRIAASATQPSAIGSTIAMLPAR